MSAWIVSTGHIDALVHALGVRELFPDGLGPDQVGQILHDENYRSIRARYGDTDVAPQYTYRQPPVSWSASELLHHLGCYDYQTCESGDYNETAAKALVEILEDALEKDGGDRDAPKGPEELPWGIPTCGYRHSDWQDCQTAGCPSVAGVAVDA